MIHNHGLSSWTLYTWFYQFLFKSQCEVKYDDHEGILGHQFHNLLIICRNIKQIRVIQTWFDLLSTLLSVFFNSICVWKAQWARAIFNYIAGAPPPPPIQPFRPPQWKSLLSKYKQNIGRKVKFTTRFDILITEIFFVNLMSCLLSSNDSMSFWKC
jgi:hypothetical protein